MTPAVALLAAPSAEEASLSGIVGFVRASLGLIRPHSGLAALVLLTILPTVGYLALEPLIFKAVIDDAIPAGSLGRLAFYIAVLAALLVVRLGAEVTRDYYSARLGLAAVNDLRERLFRHLHALPQDFHGKREVGELTYRFNSDLAVVESAIAREYPIAVARVLTILACGALLFSIDWRIALLDVVFVLLLSVAPRYLEPPAERATEEAQEAATRLGTTVQETLSAQTVVKVFGLGDVMLARFRQRLDALTRGGVRFALVTGLLTATVRTGGNTLIVIALAAGATLVITTGLSVGTMIAFMELAWAVGEAIAESSSIVRPLQLAAGAHRRVDELLRVRSTVPDRATAPPLPPFRDRISYETVSLSYTGERLELDGVSFEIARGSNVALVGPSGSGKSTLLNLTLRFYDPNGGRVSIDGIDLRTVALGSWYAQIGTVFQDNFLFDTTIRENIRLGRPGATDAEVEAAARAAEIHGAILEMARGYDTPVGERGGRLSGGQRQRVAIARAVIRDPAVLVLDEATSALDPGTETQINATIAGLARGRTVISVTHRLSSIVEADRIIVLERGRITEQGTHRELLAHDGPYRRLWQRQSGFAVSADGRHAEVDAARLRLVPLFEALDDEALAELTERFSPQYFEAGDVVCREGEPGSDFYIVARGTLEALQRVADGDPRVIARMNDGDFFGEIALLEDVPRTATVGASTSCVLLKLDRAQFDKLLERNPGVREIVERTARARRSADGR